MSFVLSDASRLGPDTKMSTGASSCHHACYTSIDGVQTLFVTTDTMGDSPAVITFTPAEETFLRRWAKSVERGLESGKSCHIPGTSVTLIREGDQVTWAQRSDDGGESIIIDSHGAFMALRAKLADPTHRFSYREDIRLQRVA